MTFFDVLIARKGPIEVPGATGPITQRSHHLTNQKVLEMVTAEDLRNRKVLDVGAGEGYLVALLGEYVQENLRCDAGQVLRACDTKPELFKYRPVVCDPIGSDGRLPYPDESFDVVTCIEVVEHLEDQFRLAREVFRLCRPGGRLLLSTPNILNINSRLRFLHSGFATLFDPVPLGEEDPVGLAGHIHPVGFYYLAHLLHRAGFQRVRPHFDLPKKSGILFAALFYPFVRLWHAGFRRRMRRKYPALYEENSTLLDSLNSWGMLTSRSVIVEAVK